jgi:hypothetical protein
VTYFLSTTASFSTVYQQESHGCCRADDNSLLGYKFVQEVPGSRYYVIRPVVYGCKVAHHARLDDNVIIVDRVSFRLL